MRDLLGKLWISIPVQITYTNWCSIQFSKLIQFMASGISLNFLLVFEKKKQIMSNATFGRILAL